MQKIAGTITERPPGHSDKSLKADLLDYQEEIADLQHLLYAEAKQSLLVIFQGMDTSGKDGAASAVFRMCTPYGVHAYSFKKPTPKEFGHDFLWRVHQHAPEKGYVQIFNRSHYEDVLIQRVHAWIDHDRFINRIEAINAFEKLLVFDNRTTIIKFFLNISHARQEEKLNERMTHPKKQWKYNPGDWEERKHWEKYMTCYDDVLHLSSIPWHVIPADDSLYRNYIAAQIVRDALKAMDPKRPVISTVG